LTVKRQAEVKNEHKMISELKQALQRRPKQGAESKHQVNH